MPKIEPKEINRDLLINQSTGLSEDLSKGREDPRFILKELNKKLKSPKITSDEEDYLKQIHRQLVFREFARSSIEQQSYRQPPGARGWDDPEFKKLRKAQTGIPVIDAAVREMATTGKPHNRARLLLTRYAIRNLNIDPEEVSKWYKKSFKDYDPIITTFNVVQAASGAPFGEPYFRKSNPITATKKLDPGGEYREKWLPKDYQKGDLKKIEEEIINEGHKEWLKRWKSSKPLSDLPQRKLYPTKDNPEGIYFVQDSLRAKGSFKPYYKAFKENEKEFLKKAYIKMKIREDDDKVNRRLKKIKPLFTTRDIANKG